MQITFFLQISILLIDHQIKFLTLYPSQWPLISLYQINFLSYQTNPSLIFSLNLRNSNLKFDTINLGQPSNRAVINSKGLYLFVDFSNFSHYKASKMKHQCLYPWDHRHRTHPMILWSINSQQQSKAKFSSCYPFPEAIL